MKPFTPCKGKTACRDDGKQCLVCGRSLQEIEDTRKLIDALAELAIAQEYENVGEFAAYVRAKWRRKLPIEEKTNANKRAKDSICLPRAADGRAAWGLATGI